MTARWRVLLLLAVAAVVLAVSALVHAQTPLDEQVRSVAAQLRCPVCQNLSVADSPSELAQEMRGVIREQLQAGKTPEEVKAYFLSKYGDWILLSPRPRGLNLLVWMGPFAAAIVGLGVAALAVRRWARRARARPRQIASGPLVERVRREALRDESDLAAAEGVSVLEAERRRLYAALRELHFDFRCGKLAAQDYQSMREEYEALAAEVLEQLEQAPPGPGSGADRGGEPVGAAAREGETAAARRGRAVRGRLVAGGVFVLIFGLALGYVLTQSLRPRLGEQDSITGDFLTGTGPGGIMPGSRGPEQSVARLLASGRAAYERGDWKAAIEGFRQVLAIDPGHPEAHTFLGLILLRAGHVDGSLLAVDRALEKNPAYPFALWVKGLALFEGRQDYAGAIAAWERLMTQSLSEVDGDRVALMLTEARKRLVDAKRSPGQVTPAVPVIAGTVRLAPTLGGDRAGGTLFVIARKGNGAPLAVKRIPNPVFPVAFALGPEDRMIGDRPFSGEVTLVARLKRDGTAGPPGPGDLEGAAGRPVVVGQRGIEITLDRAR